MPDIPPIDDLENLSATGALLEAMLRQWVEEIAECAPPDIVTLSEAIDFFTRLTAIRKTLIKLSRLTKPRPNNSRTSSNSHTTDLPQVNLPEPNIPQIPCVPDIPHDRIRPDLEAISTALETVFPHDDPTDPTDPTDLPSDPSDPSDASSSHTSHSSYSPIRNPQSEIRNPIPRRFG